MSAKQKIKTFLWFDTNAEEAANYNDHEPPHFHVRYGEQRAIIGIAPLALLRGDLAPRVLAMVMEWTAIHLDTLRDDWALARAQQPLLPIAPLE